VGLRRGGTNFPQSYDGTRDINEFAPGQCSVANGSQMIACKYEERNC
jgi:hypothetical protein